MQKPESCDEGRSSACSQYNLSVRLKSTARKQGRAGQIIHTACRNSSFYIWYRWLKNMEIYVTINLDRELLTLPLLNRGARRTAIWELLVRRFSGLFYFPDPTHIFLSVHFLVFRPVSGANPKGIKTKAYNYKTAGFLCSAIVWPPQKNYNKSSSP